MKIYSFKTYIIRGKMNHMVADEPELELVSDVEELQQASELE